MIIPKGNTKEELKLREEIIQYCITATETQKKEIDRSAL